MTNGCKIKLGGHDVDLAEVTKADLVKEAMASGMFLFLDTLHGGTFRLYFESPAALGKWLHDNNLTEVKDGKLC